MSRHVRRRYDRMAALLLAVGITAVALLGGLGYVGDPSNGGLATVSASRPAPTLAAVTAVPRSTGSATPARADSASASSLPVASGTGRRVVFDMSAQRVWLVGADDDIQRSYLVSGSVTHNLHPGHYAVYSRSRYAVGVDDTGVMQYFVRFTRGHNAAIGFHDIPTQNGVPLQSTAQLGTPQSHGCIRQARPDAILLWDFAPVGTPVDVVA